MPKIWKYTYLTITLIASCIYLAYFSYPDTDLHLVSCNVGQGDAALIIYGDHQYLIDGGPDNKVEDCLSKYVPFWDRKIEAVILTHPEKDHYGGLMEVVKRYNPEYFIKSNIETSSQDYRLLEEQVGGMGVKVKEVTSPMTIRDSLLSLDIFPQAETDKKINTNDRALVTWIKYGTFDAVFTADAGKARLDNWSRSYLHEGVEYIKISHHGSVTGTDGILLNLTEPEIAVISVGKNQWGHPNTEVINLLNERKIKYLRTDEMGDIETVTDGKSWWLEK